MLSLPLLGSGAKLTEQGVDSFHKEHLAFGTTSNDEFSDRELAKKLTSSEILVGNFAMLKACKKTEVLLNEFTFSNAQRTKKNNVKQVIT